MRDKELRKHYQESTEIQEYKENHISLQKPAQTNDQKTPKKKGIVIAEIASRTKKK